MTFGSNLASHSPHAHPAATPTCETCGHDCREGSRRRERLVRNGWCPQWSYRAAEQGSIRANPWELPGGRRPNAQPVIGIDADGNMRVWRSMTQCCDEMSVCTKNLREWVASGEPHRGYVFKFMEEESDGRLRVLRNGCAR